MRINAEWKGRNLEDFAQLSISDYMLLEHLLNLKICSSESEEMNRELLTLKARLLFIINNTY